MTTPPTLHRPHINHTYAQAHSSFYRCALHTVLYITSNSNRWQHSQFGNDACCASKHIVCPAMKAINDDSRWLPQPLQQVDGQMELPCQPPVIITLYCFCIHCAADCYAQPCAFPTQPFLYSSICSCKYLITSDHNISVSAYTHTHATVPPPLPGFQVTRPPCV